MSKKIGLKTMAGFCRQAAVSIKAGLPLTRALPLITRESRDKRLRRAIKRITTDISAGETLGDALRRSADYFPPMFVEMLAAGERSGNIEEVFRQLGDYFDMRLKIRRAVISACIYPAIQLTMLFAVFSLIMIVSSSDKAATAQMVALYTAEALAAFAVVYWFFWRTRPGHAIRDNVALGLPLFRSITMKLCMARFTRSLAMQIEAGMPVVEAIESSARSVGNSVVTRSMMKMAGPVSQGESLAEAIKNSRYATPIVREMLAIAEETGEFGDPLNRVAAIYEEEAFMVLEALPKFIGPAIMVFVGICVLLLFLKVYIRPLLEAGGM
jgi:type IV pilus assembly protein PilC